MTSITSDAPLSESASTSAQTDGKPPWEAFDPEGYFQHYYGEPHPDDWELTVRAAMALRRAEPAPGQTGVHVMDVGTGPSLIPLLAALPVATQLTAWEYAQPNIAWLRNELAGPSLRPQWLHFWRAVQKAHESSAPLTGDPLPMLAARTRVSKGSIYDLPPHACDAATMFFCAESITSHIGEFERALSAFIAAVRPGGVIAAAFLAGSSGYDVCGRRFPAVRLDAVMINTLLRDRLDTFEISPVGLSPVEIRSGYSGALFVTGRTGC